MFDLQLSLNGNKVLVYSERLRYLGERGMWVEICHERDKESRFLVEFNRSHGLQVEIDKKGYWRALVLKD